MRGGVAWAGSVDVCRADDLLLTCAVGVLLPRSTDLGRAVMCLTCVCEVLSAVGLGRAVGGVQSALAALPCHQSIHPLGLT